jgi:hypothetical protein
MGAQRKQTGEPKEQSSVTPPKSVRIRRHGGAHCKPSGSLMRSPGTLPLKIATALQTDQIKCGQI